jgi:hypothetical protein
MRSISHRSVMLQTRRTAAGIAAVTIAAAGCNSLRYGLPSMVSLSAETDQIISLPPLDLPARADHLEAPQPPPLHTSVNASGWMHGFTVEIMDASGDTVPGSVLHHIKVLMPDRRELFMPIALRLVGAGAETRSARVIHGMGIPIEAGDSLLVTAMLHNPTERDFTGVSVRVRLHYTPAPATPKPAEVYPFYLHVASPQGPSEYDLPPGYSERSWEARPAAAGRIIALGGHLHRHGATLRLSDLTTGREIWRTRAQLDSSGNILGVGRKIYKWGRGPRLDPTHTYRVTAAYFNPTRDTIRAGGMGTLGGVFKPVGAWPMRDASDPLYLLDLEREVGGHHGAPVQPHHAGHEERR